MSSFDAIEPGRNLLFGLLAFQNNFIDRRALLSAFDDWTNAKSRPLGRVLVDQGAITEDLLALIDGLVAAHLAQHGDEPAQSLAALTPIGSVRKDLEALADPGTKASLFQVSAAWADFDPYATKAPSGADQASSGRPSGSEPFETYAPSVGTASSSGVRFQVLRPLNHGGMGVVSVALDKELDRSIALKEIRESAADDRAYRARFLAEAEITGKLEHPGIIPIYGLGTYGDGRPFYAMRLIRGDKTGSLMDAIERFHGEPNPSGRIVEFRGLMGRFLDVCNALSYAHSKGVLHRDLKPDNILLGPYGETLVVDWGLAKAAGRPDPAAPLDGDHVRLNLSGSELSPTLAGGAFGTPEYAPPEQMTGDLPNVGPRSDVYGLGAVLYSLMTGRAPFSRKGIDLGTLIRKIEAGDFPPPRQVRAELDKSLEAICLRALSRKPADRYESAKALAEDVERYLADEPVVAYREPWTVRTRRWAKRHRTAVTATAAALVVASVGLGAITAVQTKARNDLAAKNGELEGANRSLDVQRRRAEANESQAIAAVQRFGDVISNEPELKDNATLQDLRKRLMKEPLAFFRALRDRLQADRDTRPEALARLAEASSNLGELTDEIGDKRDALIAYREAQAIYRKLADVDPADVRARADLADGHFIIGRLLSETGEPDEGRKSFDTALAIRRELAQTYPESTEYRSDLAASYNDIGLLLRETGEVAEALQAQESALAILRKLVEEHPDNARFESELAAGHHNIGLLLSEAGELDEALQAQESALAILRKLAEEHPDVIEYKRRLAASHHNRGFLLRGSGRPDEVREALESARTIYRELADSNPSITRYQAELADADHNIGNLLRETGEAAEALEALGSAMSIQRRLADSNPAVTEFQGRLASSYNSIGTLLKETERPAEAAEAFGSALEILRKLAREHPESPEFASGLGGTLNNISLIDMDAGRFMDARTRLREAVARQREALATNPANPTYRQFLANHLANLIEASRGLDDSEGAAEAERELAELRDSDPAMVELDARLASVLAGDQEAEAEAERLRLAGRAYEKSLHAASARLYGEALAADPKLADDRQAQHRYNAACAAALAAAGKGHDEPPPDDDAKATLRAQALGWLRAELAAWEQVAQKGGEDGKELVAGTLEHWKADGDLVGVRDPAALEELPEAEREEWRRLWSGVDALLGTVRSP